MSVAQQAKAARRKARQDPRYLKQKGVSASKRDRRLSIKAAKIKLMAERRAQSNK